MGVVTNAVVVSGSLEPVFDLATTARLWPDWHPATRQVGGVTERPYLRGDVVREQGVAMGIPFETVWTIAEHDRPRLIVMTSPNGVAINYRFAQTPDGVQLTRRVEFDDEMAAKHFPSAEACATALSMESEKALTGLKTMIERILEAERAVV